MRITIKLTLRETGRAGAVDPDAVRYEEVTCEAFPTLIEVKKNRTLIKGQNLFLALPGNYDITIEALSDHVLAEA